MDDGAIELGAMDDGAMEFGAFELGAMELGAMDDGADADAAAGVLLLELVELEAAVLLEPQAATNRANAATPATTPVRPTGLLLDEPGVVVTRTSSS